MCHVSGYMGDYFRSKREKWMIKDGLRFGIIHLAVIHKQIETNRRAILEIVDEAIGRGAKIIVTPELALSGYSFRNRGDIRPYTESENGHTLSQLCRIAKKSAVYICLGIAEVDEKTDIIYNSAFVIGPAGRVLCRYRKISAESRWACAGDSRQNNTFETPWGRIGVLICSDSYYGAIVRCTALRGADLIIVIANWPPSGLDPRELWRARAIENGVFLVACNRAGFDLTMDCCEAPSCVYDPLGNKIFEGTSRNSELFIVDLPLGSNGKLDGSLRKLRLSSRRVELYRDGALNFWPVRDLTSFLGLPKTGVLPVFCVVPKAGEHPVDLIRRSIKNCESEKTLCILPAFKTGDVMLDLIKAISESRKLGVLWRDPSYSYFCGYFATPDGGITRWCVNLTAATDGERLFPEFDFGPARIAFVPFDVVRHPEFALAAAKRGCDIMVSSEGFIEGEWKLLSGARTIENIAVSVCGVNGAGIWTPPQGHERWGEVLAQEGEICFLDFDTSVTRNKRFQDRVDFELLLDNEFLH